MRFPFNRRSADTPEKDPWEQGRYFQRVYEVDSFGNTIGGYVVEFPPERIHQYLHWAAEFISNNDMGCFTLLGEHAVTDEAELEILSLESAMHDATTIKFSSDKKD